MKNILKRAISSVLGLTMLSCVAVAAVGCGGDGPGGGGDTWWSTTGTLQKDAEGNVVFDNVEIKLSTIVNGDDKAAFNNLVAQFNAQYRDQINVIVTNISDGDFDQTVSQQIVNNSNPPDFLLSHQKSHLAFADNKLIQPLNETMDESGIKFNMEDFSEGVAQYTSLGSDEYLFGVPVDAQSSVVYYNKSILEKYSQDLPANRNDLLELLDKVAEQEKITPIAWSTSDKYFTQYVFTSAIIQNGGHLYDPTTEYADWESDPGNLQAFQDAIRSIRELINRSPNPLAKYGQSSSDALNQFLSGKALFYVSLPWFTESIIEGYAQLNNLTEDVVKSDYVGATSIAGWFALDENAANRDKVFGDSHSFVMTNSVTGINKKAAILEFIRWFTSTGSVGASWGEAGHITASKTIDASPEYNQSEIIADYTKKFYKGIDNFECMGNTLYYTDIITTIGSLFIDAMKNTTSDSDAALIKRLQDELNRNIDFYRM